MPIGRRHIRLSVHFRRSMSLSPYVCVCYLTVEINEVKSLEAKKKKNERAISSRRPEMIFRKVRTPDTRFCPVRPPVPPDQPDATDKRPPLLPPPLSVYTNPFSSPYRICNGYYYQPRVVSLITFLSVTRFSGETLFRHRRNTYSDRPRN